MIERLKEKRTALISRTVTRGLPPDAATQAGLVPHPNLKPSGIDWLGEVPEHWDVKRIKGVATYWVSNVDKVPAEEEVPGAHCVTTPTSTTTTISGRTWAPNGKYDGNSR